METTKNSSKDEWINSLRYIYFIEYYSANKKNEILTTRRGDPEGIDAATMLTHFLGPRYLQLAKNWIPTASMWGAMGGVGLVWATDWRLILDWVLYINGKFKKDE